MQAEARAEPAAKRARAAKEAKYVVLDIEGTVAAIDFVTKTLFPYARKHVAAFLAETFDTPETAASLEALRKQLALVRFPPRMLCRSNDSLLAHSTGSLLLHYWLACSPCVTRHLNRLGRLGGMKFPQAEQQPRLSEGTPKLPTIFPESEHPSESPAQTLQSTLLRARRYVQDVEAVRGLLLRVSDQIPLL